MSTIFTIGIFLSLFLSVLLLSKKQNTLSDKLLAAWLVIIGLHLTNYYLYSLDFWTKYPHLVGVALPLPLLHGPFLFLYTLYSLRNDNRMRKIDLLHFAPALLTWLYMCQFYFFYTVEEKIMVDQGLLNDFAVFNIIILVAFILSGLAYPILAYRTVGKHRALLDANYSYDSRLSLSWLKYCIWGLATIFLTVAIFSTLQNVVGIDFSFNINFIYYTEIVIFVICIGYFGIRYQGLFSDPEGNKSVELVPAKPQGEYKKSGLKPDTAERIHIQLMDIMQTEKPYTNPKLTLNELAQSLDVSPNHLSQIINQYEKVNFHDFINRFRINEFIEKATNNREFSILAHAFDSGFNSKSSFNNVFKKHHGVPPSRYIAQITQRAA